MEILETKANTMTNQWKKVAIGGEQQFDGETGTKF